MNDNRYQQLLSAAARAGDASKTHVHKYVFTCTYVNGINITRDMYAKIFGNNEVEDVYLNNNVFVLIPQKCNVILLRMASLDALTDALDKDTYEISITYAKDDANPIPNIPFAIMVERNGNNSYLASLLIPTALLISSHDTYNDDPYDLACYVMKTKNFTAKFIAGIE